MSLRSAARSAGPYVVRSIKTSLDLLQSLADLIPIPYVTIAIDAACQLLEIAEVRSLKNLAAPVVLRPSLSFQKVKSNRGELERLIEQVSRLMLVVVTPLRGKEERSIPKTLKSNLERLSEYVFPLLLWRSLGVQLLIVVPGLFGASVHSSKS